MQLCIFFFSTERNTRRISWTWIRLLWFLYWFFFLLLYIEWNNINSPNTSFMFDHHFIPHHKFSVTSLFLFQPNVENKKKCIIWFFWLLYENYDKKKKRKKTKNEKRERVSKQRLMKSSFVLDDVLVGECVVGWIGQTSCVGRKLLG